MELDNLHCPQFVDFTNTATFDIYDGADVYFGKRERGERESSLINELLKTFYF